MYEKLASIIRESNNIVFIGGAGVSTESGIPDFRSKSGIYNTCTDYGVSPETIVTHDYFMKYPEVYFQFHFERIVKIDVEPNKAHYALAELEKAGKMRAVITQNVDGLHQKAGSKNVLELHGSMHRNYCMQCGEKYPVEYVMKPPKSRMEFIPLCEKCGGIVRPDIVLFGESLSSEVLSKSISAISEADVLIVGGTSLTVYPAASLQNYFNGRHIVIINRDETPYDSKASMLISDSIGEVFSAVMEQL